MPLPIPNHEFNFNRDLNENNGLIFQPDRQANIVIQGDINNGGRDDFLVKFQYYTSLFIYFGEENYNWQGKQLLTKERFSPDLADVTIRNSHAKPVHTYRADCDFNGDAITDLVVHSHIPDSGQYYYREMYVIFGGDWLVPNTTIDIATTSFSGFIVRETMDSTHQNTHLEGMFCGDINGDKENDLVAGVWSGSSSGFHKLCVIYNTSLLREGYYFLDTLDGKNGTCVDVKTHGSRAITIGDVDADGYDDLIMTVPAKAGSSNYGHFQVDILFGQAIASGVRQTNRSILMQGDGGVSIHGLDTSVSYYPTIHHLSRRPPKLIKSTDLDGDGIADVIISNPAAFPHYEAVDMGTSYTVLDSLGQTYILRGRTDLGKEEIIDLNDAVSNRDAYQLDGVKLNGRLGSFGTTFDMNNDYYDDIVLSAPNAAYEESAGIDSLLVLSGTFAGELNLLYGGKNFSQWFDQDLSQIQGLNGFRVTLGKENRNSLGFELSSKGDFNGDGITDLLFSIGGTYSASTWEKYGVMYGNAWPVFHKNELILYKGQEEILLDVSNLNVTDANDPADELDIVVDFVDNGYFARRDNITVPLLDFKQGWIFLGDIVFIPQGPLAPKYALNATDGKIVVGPMKATVIYSPGPEWVNKRFDLVQGHHVIPVSTDMLQAIDNISAPAELRIRVVETQHCYFAYAQDVQQPTFNFSQYRIDSDGIRLVCDGERNTPAVHLDVSNGYTSTGRVSIDISYKQSPLIFLHPLEIDQGQAKILTAKEIQFFDGGYASGNVLMTVWVEHGHFFFSHQPEVPIDSFTQQQFDMGWVGIAHNDSDSPLAYSLTTQAEDAMSKPYSSVVNFNWRPVLQTNHLETEQGKAIRVTSAHLSASDKNGDDGQLIFYPHTQGGYFAWADDMRQVNEFTQYAIWGGKLYFVTYDTGTVPYCEIRVSDGRIVTSPEITTIDFKPTPLWKSIVAPSLVVTFSITVLGIAMGCYRSKRSRDKNPHVKYFVQELGLQTSDLTSVAGAQIVNFVSSVFMETKKDERFSNYIDNRQVKERFMTLLVQEIQLPQRKLLVKAGCFDRALSSCSAYGPYQLDLFAAFHELSEIVENTKQAFISTHGAPQVVASQDVRPASPVIERQNRSCWHSFCGLFGQGDRSVMASEVYQSLSESSVRAPQ